MCHPCLREKCVCARVLLNIYAYTPAPFHGSDSVCSDTRRVKVTGTVSRKRQRPAMCHCGRHRFTETTTSTSLSFLTPFHAAVTFCNAMRELLRSHHVIMCPSLQSTVVVCVANAKLVWGCSPTARRIYLHVDTRGAVKGLNALLTLCDGNESVF